jgi:hypothetical protein
MDWICRLVPKCVHILVVKHEEEMLFGTYRRTRGDNIKVDIKETVCEGMD